MWDQLFLSSLSSLHINARSQRVGKIRQNSLHCIVRHRFRGLCSPCDALFVLDRGPSMSGILSRMNRQKSGSIVFPVGWKRSRSLPTASLNASNSHGSKRQFGISSGWQ